MYWTLNKCESDQKTKNEVNNKEKATTTAKRRLRKEDLEWGMGRGRSLENRE
jgi:hypothetical protein